MSGLLDRDTEFDAMAGSLNNPDWADISLHAYRQRWHDAAGAKEHEEVERRLAESPTIRIQTIMLQGAEDRDNMPVTSENKERYFSDGYERRLLPGIGHFVPREAPDVFADAICAIAERRVKGNSSPSARQASSGPRERLLRERFITAPSTCLLADGLVRHGVEFILSQSVPAALALACEDRDIRNITYRQENLGGVIADGYVRVSGRVPVMLCQNEPAAALALAPFAEAIKAVMPSPWLAAPDIETF
jgi:hypothetical protein